MRKAAIVVNDTALLMNGDIKAPFLKHLAELRSSILQSVLAVAVMFVPCYYFRFELLKIIIAPVLSALPPGSSLIFTNPVEGFTSLIAASLFSSVALSSPFILYRIWRFIAPGLYAGERRGLFLFVFFGTVLFFTGILFCHSLVAPRALEFLLGKHSSDFFSAMPSLSRSLSFLLTMCLGFAAVFEFPLIAFFLSRWGVVTPQTLAASRKYAYLIGSVLTAVITPTTDFVSMMFLFIPLVMFYEAGIITARMFAKR